MTKDIRFALILGAMALLIGQALATVDMARSVLGDFDTLRHTHLWVVFVGTLLMDALVLYLFTRPARRDLALTLGAGSGVALLLMWALPLAGAKINTGLLVFGCLGTGLGGAALFRLCWQAAHAQDRERDLARHLLWVVAFVALMTVSMGALMKGAIALQPGTFDLITLHVDGSLGFQASAIFAQYGAAFPWFKTLLTVVYAALAVLPTTLYGLQFTGRHAPPASIVKAWVWAIPLVFLAYFLYPVCGPLYLLGPNLFPLEIPPLEALNTQVTVVSSAPRNGVPSMHFGWTLLVWMNAGLLHDRKLAKYVRAFCALFLGLTSLATLGLGEHYLIDLVIAVPFIVGVQALCTDVLSWHQPARRNACIAGFGMALAWMLGLRFGYELFIAVPGLTWICTLLTIAGSIAVYRPLARESLACAALLPPMPLKDEVRPDTSPDKETKRQVRYVGAMFVLSGIAGIMYEVLFSKALALTFGSTSTATYTVLATYMGGIAIGSWLGGRIGASHPRPLVLYAGCEMAIALYCAMTPMIFRGIQAFYVDLAAGVSPDAPILTAFRLSLGVAALLLPTILMGMTLPILARFLQDKSDSLGKTVAVLYGANVLGAALGALLAGYAVLPVLGVNRTTLMAAVLNLMVALLAIELHKKTLVSGTTGHALFPASAAAAESGRPGEHRWLGAFALVVLGIGGAITLAMEVKYFHLLAVVAGNSTYAFSLMLFTFLLGLGAGAEIARRLLGLGLPLRQLLGWLELGLACVILGGVFLWSAMPEHFARYEFFPMVREFASREVVRAVVCWLAMFPPALFIGALYPVAMECVGRARAGNPIGALGFAAAFNTLGNILGVLVGAFVLLPYVGALRSIQLLGVTCAVLGIVALWRRGEPPVLYRWAPAALAAVLLAIQPASFDYNKLASGANVYFYSQGFGKIIDHAESVDGGLTSVALREVPNHPPVRTLLTNGKFQGNDAEQGEMPAQIGFALTPLLHTEHRQRALVIGYGTGVSARALHDAGFRELDVVDLSADIVRMANKHFAGVNGRVTERPGVKTYITDGRNYLMLQEREYDLIGMEISSIWFAGAASLYNREFYALAKKRLAPHGVLQQWMQLHHISQQDVLRIVGSVRAEFQYVWLYLIGGQGILIASNDAGAGPDRVHVEALKRTPQLKPLLDILRSDPGDLMKNVLLDPAGTDRFLNAFGVPAWIWVSTDDNLYLEYSTPKGNVLDGLKSLEGNRRFIAKHAAAPGEAEVASAP